MMFPIKQSFSSALAGAASAISKPFSRSKKVEKSKTPLEQLFHNCKASSAKQNSLIERERELKTRLEKSKALDIRLGMLVQKTKSASIISTSDLDQLHQARKASALKQSCQGAGAATGTPSSSISDTPSSSISDEVVISPVKLLKKQPVDKMPNLDVLLKQLDAVDARLDKLSDKLSKYQATQTKKARIIRFCRNIGSTIVAAVTNVFKRICGLFHKTNVAEANIKSTNVAEANIKSTNVAEANIKSTNVAESNIKSGGDQISFKKATVNEAFDSMVEDLEAEKQRRIEDLVNFFSY